MTISPAKCKHLATTALTAKRGRAQLTDKKGGGSAENRWRGEKFFLGYIYFELQLVASI